MLVSQKHGDDAELKPASHSFNNLIGKRHPVARIDLRAIFYTHAAETTEFQNAEDYTDETGITSWRKSNDQIQ